MEVNSEDSQLCAEVCGRGDYFWKTGLLSDCQFLVGTAPRQELISIHKLILSMASPVFETMFCGSIPEKGDCITIVDIQPETFKLLKDYIYKGSLNTNSVDDVCNLCYAAKKYMMPHLVIKCVKYLCKMADTENVLQLLNFALLFNAKPLLEKCESIICCQTNDILNTKDSENVDLEVVNYVFSLDTLNIDSELDLIEAAARYAEAPDNSLIATLVLPPNDKSESHTLDDEITKNESESSTHSNKTNEIVDSSPVPTANLLKDARKISKIRSLVEKIRFLALTSQQFAECSVRSSILTSSEETAIIFNLASKNTNVPMPRSFTINRAGRHRMIEVGSSGSGVLFKVQDVRNLTGVVDSPPFYVNNVPWRIQLKRSTDDIYLGFSVFCQPYYASMNWSCKAEVQLCLISDKVNISRNFTRLFTIDDNNWGFSQVVAWSDVFDPIKGFLNNDAITLEVHIVVKEQQGIS